MIESLIVLFSELVNTAIPLLPLRDTVVLYTVLFVELLIVRLSPVLLKILQFEMLLFVFMPMMYTG